MTSITDRIDLRASKKVFDELKSGHKIMLPNNLINSFNAIIGKNMNFTTEEYTDELSNIRLVKKLLLVLVYGND